MEGLYLKITQDFSPDPKEARFGGIDSPMAVEKGDIIFDVRKRGDGWLCGKNLNSGKTGKFPDSCAAKLTGNSKKGCDPTSNNPESDKKDEKKQTENNKPSWLQHRVNPPAARKTPLYPKPFAGNIRQPQEKEKEKEEKMETSGDSGVVEDSPDANYCNDNESPKSERDAKQTGSTVKDVKQKEPKVSQKPIQQENSEAGKENDTKGLPSRTTTRPSKLYGKTREGGKTPDPKALPRGDTKNTSSSFPRSVSTPKETAEDDNYEPVENSCEEKRTVPRETAKRVQPKEELKTRSHTPALKINPNEGVEKNQSNVKSINSAGVAALNIQENPLLKNEESIYQVPQVVGPKKPPRSAEPGCSECNEPHIYDTPMHCQYLPCSPTLDNYEPTVEKEKEETAKRASTSLKPTSSVIRKTKEQMRSRMASYESIEAEGRRSTESIKEAVKTAKETKEKFLTSSKWPKTRIVLGIIAGILLGVFICLTLYFLAHLHIVICVVSALIIGLVAAITLGFLDRTRIQCIVLLVFPSLFSTGGKISLWLLITYFVVSGSLCNFIENVRITALTRGCLMHSNNSASNGSSVESPAGLVVLDPKNREVVERVRQYENISLTLRIFINESLLLTSQIGSRDNDSSDAVCITFLKRAHNSCSVEIDTKYKECTQLLASTGNKQDVERKCESLRNACEYLTDAYVRRSCAQINAANTNTLLKIKNIAERSPDRMRTKEMPPPVYSDAVISAGEQCEFIVIVALLLPLLALLVLYEAYSYHKLYLSCNEFDNHYLTFRFKSIEDMRKSSGAADLLVPLKKAELKKFVQPTACQFAQAERISMLKYLALYFIYLIFALMIVLLDYFFYFVIVNEEPQSNMLQGCEGAINSPQKTHTIVISTLLGVLLLIILLQAFVLRLRRLIVSRFYPRRERKRIAYLYYKLLEERKNFYKSVIEKMNNFSGETEILNSLDTVRVLCNNFSWIKALLEFVGVNLRRCAVCGTGLNRKYIYCETEDCDVIYCRTCFWDLESKCLGCMRDSKMTSRSSSVSGQSQRKKNDYAKAV